MEAIHKSRNNRLRKRRIWPVLFFFGVAFIAISVLIVHILKLFIVNVSDTKISQLYDDAQYIGVVVQQYIDQMKNPDDVEGIIEVIRNEVSDEEGICIIGSQGEIIYSEGGTPDLEQFVANSMYEDIIVYADTESKKGWKKSGLDIIPQRLVDKTISNRKYSANDRNWLLQELFNAPCWIEIPVEHNEYRLYIKTSISIQRKDAMYMSVSLAIAHIGSLFPMAILAIHGLVTAIYQRNIMKMLYVDSSTGGMNWTYLQIVGNKIIRRRRNRKKTFAIVSLSVDRFQNYCSCFGVHAGEELLERIDGFLKIRMNRSECFGHYGQADFGLLIFCKDETDCYNRLRSLITELTGLVSERRVNYHAGVYMLYPEEKQANYFARPNKNIDFEQLYNYAASSNKPIGNIGDTHITVFDEKLLEERRWERMVEGSMEDALIRGEFQVYLQPKFNPASGKLVGAEALARWVSPTMGMIPPAKFIPIFEDTGCIIKLDDYMISHIAKLQTEWGLKGKKVVPVSVNVSRANFLQEDIAEHICRIVDDYGTSHSLVELEVTESTFFDDKETMINIVRKLKSYGFIISMDDFGAGYSSLNSLKDLPVDILKLDVEFFRGEDADRRGETVVKEAIVLAQNLHMKVVAEGIERKDQVDFLAEHGCDMIQGFYYAQPMPVEEFEKLLETDSFI